MHRIRDGREATAGGGYERKREIYEDRGGETRAT